MPFTAMQMPNENRAHEDEEETMDIPVKRLNRELVYTGKVIKIYKDHVIANGNETNWDFIHHDGAAAVVAVDDDGQLLMVRQYRNALDRFTLELPAGKVDDIEEPRRICAFRELEEETGKKVHSPDELEFLIRVNTTVAFCDEQIDIFVARNLQPSVQHLDADEAINVESWSVEDLLELIYKGEMTDAKTVAGILAYARKYHAKAM